MTAMTDEERNKKARNAMFVMIGVEVVAFIVFWTVQTFLHNPKLAFALLIIGVLLGAGYYVYEVSKLRPKGEG
jgi:FtsH-binding integral membrane protein